MVVAERELLRAREIGIAPDVEQLFRIQLGVIYAERHRAGGVHAEDPAGSRGSLVEAVDAASQMVVAILQLAAAVGHGYRAVESRGARDQLEVVLIKRKFRRGDVRQSVCLQLRRRQRNYTRRRENVSQILRVEEEENPVLPYRPADSAAEIVGIRPASGSARRVGEE